MIWRPFTSFLRNKAADAGDAGGGSGGGGASAGDAETRRGGDAETGVVDLSPRLAERLNPRQAAILKERKKAKAEKQSGGASEGEGAATAGAKVDVTPPVKKAGEVAGAGGGETTLAGSAGSGSSTASGGDEGIVIDFGAVDGAGAGDGGGGEETATAEPDTTGLDEKAKAEVLKVHKDNAKIRKRAQDAEKERDEFKAKHEEAAKRLIERENSPPVASNNLFAGFQDPRQVQTWVNDAKVRINKILDKSVADKKHKLPNGEEIDLAEDEVGNLTAAQSILADAAGWSEQRKTLGSSVEKAKPIVKAFEKVPEYAAHHAEIAKQDPHAHWPRMVATSAIGELVASGKYRLVQNISGKAAAASNAASTVSGAQNQTAKNQIAKAAPVEVASAVPPASRTDGKDGSAVEIPSALQKRAMTGDQEALREVIRLKTRRGAQRNAA